jgi:hypothetical protein
MIKISPLNWLLSLLGKATIVKFATVVKFKHGKHWVGKRQ